ncbi:MAG: hypothetical protein WC718_12240 [Phycisphaerales bacterium]|jgi:GNAT superfamily N-acetyltransferase
MSTLKFPTLSAAAARTPWHLNIAIARGTWFDYLRLSQHHYRLGHPATIDTVLSATHGGRLVGVLVTSRPVLNAGWRRPAWGERFSPPASKRDIAQRLNAEVRTISRVIVEPRYRGQSIARRLVAAYLAQPTTTHTEALASMGRWCPFFERAGMTRVPFAPPRRDVAFARVIREAGLKPWMLADLTVARRLLETRPEVREGLARWANASRATRRHTISPQLLVLAASTIAAPPVAYVFTGPKRQQTRRDFRPKAWSPVAGGEASHRAPPPENALPRPRP